MYRIQTSDALSAKPGEQRAEFSSSQPVQESPHLSSFIFESWARPQSHLHAKQDLTRYIAIWAKFANSLVYSIS